MFGIRKGRRMFAIALTLVVLVSTVVLLYQYWSGALLVDDGAAADTAAAPDIMVPQPSLHIDHAA
ncbi:MAG: hypothetical protein WEB52_06265 [Dehalococcoidia bacterium]